MSKEVKKEVKKEEVKSVSSRPKWKVVDTKMFKMMYQTNAPYYDEFSSGKSIEVDENDVFIKDLITNKIIVKE